MQCQSSSQTISNMRTNHLKIEKACRDLIFGCSHWEYFNYSTLWKNNQIRYCTFRILSFKLVFRFAGMTYACI